MTNYLIAISGLLGAGVLIWALGPRRAVRLYTEDSVSSEWLQNQHYTSGKGAGVSCS